MVVPPVHGVPSEQVFRDLGDRVDQLQLLSIMNNVCVFLLMMDKAATVWACPITLVAFIRVFSCMPTSVVNQVIRALKLLPAEVTCVTELRLVDQLMLLQRVLQLEGHATVLASKVTDI